jgi:hypothetical protein
MSQNRPMTTPSAPLNHALCRLGWTTLANYDRWLWTDPTRFRSPSGCWRKNAYALSARQGPDPQGMMAQQDLDGTTCSTGICRPIVLYAEVASFLPLSRHLITGIINAKVSPMRHTLTPIPPRMRPVRLPSATVTAGPKIVPNIVGFWW